MSQLKPGRMTRGLVALVGLAFGSLAIAASAPADFTTTLTAEERAAAGLDKLTSAELARLKAVVERYKSGEVAVVQQEAEQKVAAAREEAEVKVAAAEAKAEREVRQDDGRKPGWLSALVTLQRASEKPEEQQALESRLGGEFRGWRKGTVFTLENGQRWQCEDRGEYVVPARPAPAVRIRPGMLGSYWMEIEGVRGRVKVKPITL